MEFQTAYGPHLKVRFETVGPSLTRQASKAECDINRVMERFEKTGILEHRNTFQGAYGDFTEVPQDYHEAVNQVLAADGMFASLPSKIRRRFGNDPAEFVDFVADPRNAEELARMGLSKPEEGELLDEEPGKAPRPSKAAPGGSPAPSKGAEQAPGDGPAE